jgi:hypothetical protein
MDIKIEGFKKNDNTDEPEVILSTSGHRELHLVIDDEQLLELCGFLRLSYCPTCEGMPAKVTHCKTCDGVGYDIPWQRSW